MANLRDLDRATRIVIKCGTSTVSNPDGTPSLVRLSGVVESIAKLMHEGKQVVLVTSGAVGCGRSKVRRNNALHRSFHDLQRMTGGDSELDAAAYAAAGQLALMAIYETLFGTQDIDASQFLVTQRDFRDAGNREHLEQSLRAIQKAGMIPIVNENDAVSGNRGYDIVPAGCFSDNDGLAALVADLVKADALILLTDVDGLYDRPPSAPGAKIIREVHPDALADVEFGAASAGGRGGMEAKVAAALQALASGVAAVALANGAEPRVVDRLFAGEALGTFFSRRVPRKPSVEHDALSDARAARGAARALQGLSGEARSAILREVAAALRSASPEIVAANEEDLAAAGSGVAHHLRQRLGLSAAKVATVADGVDALAAMKDPLATLLKRELAPGLVLEKRSCPLGVVLVIFEARPEALPQIAALALRAGCALLLKGGTEARRSNAKLLDVVRSAVLRAAPEAARPALRACLCLLPDRAAVARVLDATDDEPLVDLVVPRGSNALVAHIKRATRVPVLGHADGVCHVFIDARADAAMAAKVCVDAKCDYPAACNAMETLLVHEAAVADGRAQPALDALRAAGVALVGGAGAVRAGLVADAATTPERHEFGDLTCRVEIVADLGAACAWINAHGSGHTDAIVTEDAAAAEAFLASVDSADVFHNCSTRFADGFRFGLGCELGIATGRVHARGPVGVDGFLTYKWLLRSASGDAAAEYKGDAKTKAFTHRDL